VCLPLLIFPCTIKSRSSLLAPAHPGGPGKRAVNRLWWWWYRGPCCTSGLRLVKCGSGRSPWGAKIVKGIKNFCNAFLVHRLAERDEIWHEEGHLCIRSSPISVNFGPLFQKHKFSTADISHISTAYFSGGKKCESRYLTESLVESDTIWQC